MKLILVVLLALTTPGVVLAGEFSSKTDSLGYTHHRGPGLTGLSKTDSLGYTKSEWNRSGQRTSCVSKTDSLGYVRTTCH